MLFGGFNCDCGHLECAMPPVHIAVNILLHGLIMAIASYDSDDNPSLTGLTQETREIDVTTITSDDESFDPDANYRLLLEEARKSFSQVSNFDDHIFTMSHGSAASQTQSDSLGNFPNLVASSMVSNLKLKAMYLSALNLRAKVVFFQGSRMVDLEKKGRAKSCDCIASR